MGFVRELIDAGHQVFLDMKYYDIGETVRRAVAQVAKVGVTFLTVHGSPQVMRAAVEGRGSSGLQILAVTVLTSVMESDLPAMGYALSLKDLVALGATNAKDAGADGVIASPLEAHAIRELLGPEMLIVTPGVRSRSADVGDQKRVATPAEAIKNGADFLVIGRQVTRAIDPREAIQAIRAELAAVKI